MSSANCSASSPNRSSMSSTIKNTSTAVEGLKLISWNTSELASAYLFNLARRAWHCLLSCGAVPQMLLRNSAACFSMGAAALKRSVLNAPRSCSSCTTSLLSSTGLRCCSLHLTAASFAALFQCIAWEGRVLDSVQSSCCQHEHSMPTGGRVVLRFRTFSLRPPGAPSQSLSPHEHSASQVNHNRAKKSARVDASVVAGKERAAVLVGRWWLAIVPPRRRSSNYTLSKGMA